MMNWLIIIILAYFFFAVADFCNKFVLAGPPSPKIYTFWAGALSALAVVLIPFVEFSIPQINQLILAILAGIVYIIALFYFYTALEKFEASRVSPAIGGMLPVFTLVLSFLFLKEDFSFSAQKTIALALLLIGSVLINWQKEKGFSKDSLKITSVAALFFALYFVLAKLVFLNQPFRQGFIWTRVGGLIPAIFLLFQKDVKIKVFHGQSGFSKSLGKIFLFAQTAGAGATILQNWAVSLAPSANLAIINALQGIQYVFLFLLVVVFSFKFPNILKEEITKPILIQKIFSILLIAFALALIVM